MNQEEIKRAGKDKLQNYGREGLAPLMELFNEYGQQITSYAKHFEKGLEDGAKSIEGGESSDSESKQVADWFREGAKWVSKLESQLENGNTEDLMNFIETQGNKHPAALFATSLIAGSVVGAVGKQAYKAESSENVSSGNIQSGAGQNINQNPNQDIKIQ